MMPRIKVRGPAGATVRIIPAELVNADGSVDRSSCGRKLAYWQYTLAGGPGGETYFPKFFYHGCRYLQVECTAPDRRRAAHRRNGRGRRDQLRRPAGGHVFLLERTVQQNVHARPVGAAQQPRQRAQRLPPPRAAGLARTNPSQRPRPALQLRPESLFREGDERHGRQPDRQRPRSHHRAGIHQALRRFPRFSRMGQRLSPRRRAAVRIQRRPHALSPLLRRHGALRRLPRHAGEGTDRQLRPERLVRHRTRRSRKLEANPKGGHRHRFLLSGQHHPRPGRQTVGQGR